MRVIFVPTALVLLLEPNSVGVPPAPAQFGSAPQMRVWTWRGTHGHAPWTHGAALLVCCRKHYYMPLEV